MVIHDDYFIVTQAIGMRPYGGIHVMYKDRLVHQFISSEVETFSASRYS